VPVKEEPRTKKEMKGKKDKDNSDGGGRQGKKNKDKPDFAKRKSRKKKNIKARQKAGKTQGRTQRRRFMSYGALYIDRPAVASHASMCDLLI
jgi:hypothetical protein